MNPKKIEIYDTTLRDGSQGEGISYSVRDKVRIAEKLDHFGIRYIEAGWPGSNPKDMAFFREAKKLKLKHARIVAFGSTRRAHSKAANDPNLAALLEAGTEIITIFGKSWDLHVREVLKADLSENLRMIEDSVAFLKKHTGSVIYDAEHFFDGFKSNASYALKTLKTARAAGAKTIVLCDTNGGAMTQEISKAVTRAIAELGSAVMIGIHVHNDCGLAIANSVSAVLAGARHVQGTVNGCGERCGNADLVPIVANLQLKLGYKCVAPDRIEHLAELSRFVGEITNTLLPDNLPFVGKSAFAHKGGVHINAVLKNSRTYEHIEPEEVGNKRRFLTSELMGKTNVIEKAKEWNIRLTKDDPKTAEILKTLQDLENEGYQFEAAEASFEILVRRATNMLKPFFNIKRVEVFAENIGAAHPSAKARVVVDVGKTRGRSAEAVGDGPVNALDKALRNSLVPFYPTLAEMRLSDFKVRVLDPKAGTAAKVRVLIESSDETGLWTTVGINENIIEASWRALVDSVEYKLLRDGAKPR